MRKRDPASNGDLKDDQNPSSWRKRLFGGCLIVLGLSAFFLLVVSELATGRANVQHSEILLAAVCVCLVGLVYCRIDLLIKMLMDFYHLRSTARNVAAVLFAVLCVFWFISEAFAFPEIGGVLEMLAMWDLAYLFVWGFFRNILGPRRLALLVVFISVVLLPTVMAWGFTCSVVQRLSGGTAFSLSDGFGEVEPSTGEFIYFTIVTMTTLGYGDVTPNTWTAKVVSMAIVFTGIILFGVFISTLFTWSFIPMEQWNLRRLFLGETRDEERPQPR